MRLYSRLASPFASRVRFSLYAKEIPFECVEMPRTLDDEYRVLNPLCKVPLLQISSGLNLPESDVIVSYLEDAFPATPLLPNDPYERATNRLIAHLAQTHVFPPAIALLMLLYKPQPPLEEIAPALSKLSDAISDLDVFIPPGLEPGFVAEGRPTLADGALVPFLYFAEFAARRSNCSVLDGYPRLKEYLAGISNNPPAERVRREVLSALAS